MLWYFGTWENTVWDTCTAGKKSLKRQIHTKVLPTPQKLVFIGIWWVYVGMLWYFGTRENTVRDTWSPGKKIAKTKTSGTNSNSGTNILYHYLVVLNIKIRNCFLGTLPALVTVRGSWKYELKRLKTSRSSAPANWPPNYKPVAPLLPATHTNTSQSLRSCQLHTQIQATLRNQARLRRAHTPKSSPPAAGHT